jgi:hypothetical protein
MPTSQNGWSASPNLQLRPLVVGGCAFVPGIRDDDVVHTVLEYVLTQFHERVERLVNPGCWGFSYRENRNDPNSLSNHSSATAVDANAPQHPNGVPTARTFSAAQIAEVHKILAEVGHVVRWGGDYTGTPDAMHFEINANREAVARVAATIREGDSDMPYTDWPKKDRDALVDDVAKAVTRSILSADVFPKREDLDRSVRAALAGASERATGKPRT